MRTGDLLHIQYVCTQLCWISIDVYVYVVQYTTVVPIYIRMYVRDYVGYQ